MKRVLLMSIIMVVTILYTSSNALAYEPDRIERMYQEVSKQGDYKFYSTTAHQRHYRGYLPYLGYGVAGIFHVYKGKLYRDDLPYPIYRVIE